MMTIKAQTGAAVRPARVSSVRVQATLAGTKVLETKIKQSGAVIAATAAAALLMNTAPSMAFTNNGNNAGLGGVLPEQPRRAANNATNTAKNTANKLKGQASQVAPNLNDAKGALNNIKNNVLGNNNGIKLPGQ